MAENPPNKSQHTPGPWFISTNPGSERAQGVHAGAAASVRRNIVNWGGLSRISTAESQANARLIAAAPDFDAAAGLAITALAFEQERAQRAGDELAYRQITTAKNALIAAQNKARGREQPALRDVTPTAIAKATGTES